MENEYTFNYDEIKQIFESVPQNNSIRTKSNVSSYKTHFQARTTSSNMIENDIRPMQIPLNTNLSMRNQIYRISSPIYFKIEHFHVYHLVSIDQFYFQTRQNLYLVSRLTN